MNALQRKVAVIGLGFVGLPLSQRFLQKEYTVYGIDVDQPKLISISKGEIQNPDINNEYIKEMVEEKRFILDNTFQKIKEVGTIIICVPTPLKDNNEPDLSFVKRALQKMLPYLKENQLLCLESTTYPGTTEELLLPEIEKKGFQIGKTFYLAYSPERINPGSDVPLYKIPKVVGGITPVCLERAIEVYESIFDEVFPVSSTKAAEMTKILENTQRFINISFINDFAVLCEKMNIDVYEVIEAASTKPYGFIPYTPSPGIGGHCIPIDPIYLSWKALEYNHESTFIEIANQINKKMPVYISNKLLGFLNSTHNGLESTVLVIGVAYKKDVNDTRESASMKIMKNLIQEGINVDYYDPYVPELKIGEARFTSINESSISNMNYDVAVILTEHSNLPYERIYSIPFVFDTKKFFLQGDLKGEDRRD